jgi:exosortase A-associated hydrolase 2
VAGSTFLPSPRGDLLVTRWLPAGKPSASVLFVPPFAEEMNKCRPMQALTARRLAAQGVQAIAVDLSGTGDSAGEFREARLGHWQQDLALVADWAAGEGAPVVGLVGMRFGALLALDFAGRLPGPLRVALWQPVASGQLLLTQFLRLRVAGGLLTGRGTESVASLTAELKAGTVLEIGGYELHPELAAALDGLDLRKMTPPTGARIGWFEVAAAPAGGEQPAVSRVAADRLRDWTAAGVAAEGLALPGDTFWSTVELTTCPALVEHTARFLVPGP